MPTSAFPAPLSVTILQGTTAHYKPGVSISCKRRRISAEQAETPRLMLGTFLQDPRLFVKQNRNKRYYTAQKVRWGFYFLCLAVP